MAAILTPIATTFSAEQVRAVAELILENFVNGGDFRSYHTILTGIVYDKEVGYVGELSEVGEAHQSCRPIWTSPAAPIEKVLWQPKQWEVAISQCAADLENTLGVYSKKWGGNPDNLEGTDYMALVETLITNAITEMFWRITWFGDTDAANLNGSPAGVITNGKDVKYVNLIDGFWKQSFDQATTNTLQRVTIAANAQATYALQRSTLTPILAWGYFEEMILNAPLDLKAENAANIVIYSTLGLYEKAKQHLYKGDSSGYILAASESIGFAINGMQDLMINGYRITPMPIFDKLINIWENNGTKWNYPHRAIMATKENLQIGVPSTDAIQTLDFAYDALTRQNLMYVSDKIDAKIARPTRIMVAY